MLMKEQAPRYRDGDHEHETEAVPAFDEPSLQRAAEMFEAMGDPASKFSDCRRRAGGA
jgi:hypothetical protein